MRNIQRLEGRTINNENILKIKEIAKQRYNQQIYDANFLPIDTVDCLAAMHCINVDDEKLVLGEDWFLCYTISGNTVGFLEWVAMDDQSTKFVQSAEMLREFKRIFFENREKVFVTCMRHDSSYPFYLSMIRKGYFKEHSHAIYIDYSNGFLTEQIGQLADEYPTAEYLNSEETVTNPGILTYILHSLDFSVTESFVSRFAKRKK